MTRRCVRRGERWVRRDERASSAHDGHDGQDAADPIAIWQERVPLTLVPEVTSGSLPHWRCPPRTFSAQPAALFCPKRRAITPYPFFISNPLRAIGEPVRRSRVRQIHTSSLGTTPPSSQSEAHDAQECPLCARPPSQTIDDRPARGV
jgi:hypothetical protein